LFSIYGKEITTKGECASTTDEGMVSGLLKLFEYNNIEVDKNFQIIFIKENKNIG
jgi:hypothetical protein